MLFVIGRIVREDKNDSKHREEEGSEFCVERKEEFRIELRGGGRGGNDSISERGSKSDKEVAGHVAEEDRANGQHSEGDSHAWRQFVCVKKVGTWTT